MENNKDYIMRMIQLLFDSLLRVSKAIDKQDEDGGRQEMTYSYSLLNKSRDYFLNSSVEDIIEYLVSLDNSKQTIELTGKLLFYEAALAKENANREKLLQRARKLLEYYMDHSDSFSVESHNLIKRINIITNTTDF